MTEELKKRIQKRIDDVADENGMISFDDFIKLTKEFFGEFPQNMGEGFEDNEIPLDDIEDTTPMPDSYQANADDLPF